jgi:hypothetical protein
MSRPNGRRLRAIELALLTAAVAVVTFPTACADQLPTSAKTFDISRFSTAGAGKFETFYVKETLPLRQVLAAGRVSEDTRVLVTETAGGRLALLTEQMAFHHIAEGHASGKDWMVTF